jgi:hypothetical protein
VGNRERRRGARRGCSPRQGEDRRRKSVSGRKTVASARVLYGWRRSGGPLSMGDVSMDAAHHGEAPRVHGSIR